MPNQLTKKRPPIVVVMGHVDHGKTTLLDYIKKTDIATREAGGITQSIGAYEVAFSGQKITFIDTPGHEAFLSMRARGTKAADIALLVVAADSGVQEQTKESLEIIKGSQIPFIVVVNKIDKAGADIERVLNQLTQVGVTLEGRGGSVSWKAISAKTGEGVAELLELILLAAEMEDLAYSPQNPAAGYVLESKMDSRRGAVAALIVKDGVLRIGKKICAGNQPAKIKLMENYLGRRVDSAIPSAPVLVLGFNQLPAAGEKFKEGDCASLKAEAKEQRKNLVQAQEGKVVKLVLRAPDFGSLEALEKALKNVVLPQEYQIDVVDQAVGDIADNSVKAADAAKAIVIGFKTKITKSAANLAKNHSITLIQSNVIYQLTKELEECLQKRGMKTVVGELEVLAIFGKKSGRQIIGGRVTEGKVSNHAAFVVVRNGEEIGKGRIINLQSGKRDVPSIGEGQEGGLLAESAVDIKAEDRLLI